MQITNSYYWFKEALSPEVCQKIIDIGTERIDSLKKEGQNVSATTAGYNHKQGLEEQGLKVQAANEKTNEELITE